MDRRIFGIENEYGVTCTFRGQRRLSPDEVARYLFRKVVSWGRSSNVFLRNGARLYLDVGSHPEYATPECDDIVDLVAHDKAGERVLEGLLVDAERRLETAVLEPGQDREADALLWQYREAVISHLQEAWRSLRPVAYLFAGGTVHWMADELRRAFPRTRIAANPQQAIAIGLWRYARRKARRGT